MIRMADIQKNVARMTTADIDGRIAAGCIVTHDNRTGIAGKVSFHNIASSVVHICGKVGLNVVSLFKPFSRDAIIHTATKHGQIVIIVGGVQRFECNLIIANQLVINNRFIITAVCSFLIGFLGIVMDSVILYKPALINLKGFGA